MLVIMPRPRRGCGGIRRSSASVVRLSVSPSVCLMSRTSVLTRKPKGLGRRNFPHGYPRSHATPTPTLRSKGQKSKWGGAYCGGDLAAQLVIIILILNFTKSLISKIYCNIYVSPKTSASVGKTLEGATNVSRA